MFFFIFYFSFFIFYFLFFNFYFLIIIFFIFIFFKGYYSHQMWELKEDIKLIEYLLEKKFPNIVSLFKQHGIEVQM